MCRNRRSTRSTLPDLLRPELRAVFVGINPAVVSAKCGHYYQGKLGKRFWQRLQDYEITGLLPNGLEDDAAFAQGFGFTDVVKRPTASAQVLSRTELRTGAAQLLARLNTVFESSGALPLIIFVYRRAADFASDVLARQGYAIYAMLGPYASKLEERTKMKRLRRALADRRRNTGRMNRGVRCS